MRGAASAIACQAARLAPSTSAARSAMARADWPMTAGESLPPGHINCCSVAFCASPSITAPRSLRAASIRARTASTTTRLFSDEQLVALSKVFERTMRSAAASVSAVSSTMPATLPAPTPKAGVPLA